MAYKLIISEHADQLLDQLIFHLIYRLKTIGENYKKAASADRKFF